MCWIYMGNYTLDRKKSVFPQYSLFLTKELLTKFYIETSFRQRSGVMGTGSKLLKNTPIGLYRNHSDC